MATWLAHLRIAQAIREVTHVQPGLFALGNVAPDAGASDPIGLAFSPPKEITHYYKRDNPRYPMSDIQFYCEYLHDPELHLKDPEAHSFRIGYLCHLLTDHLWSATIGRPTKKLYREQLEADSGFWWEIKRDWHGLDFQYLLSIAEWPFWSTFKYAGYDRELVHHIPVVVIRDRQRSIVQFYEQPLENMKERAENRPDKYLHVKQMDRFVSRAGRILLRLVQNMPYDVCRLRSAGLRSLIQLYSSNTW